MGRRPWFEQGGEVGRLKVMQEFQQKSATCTWAAAIAMYQIRGVIALLVFLSVAPVFTAYDVILIHSVRVEHVLCPASS